MSVSPKNILDFAARLSNEGDEVSWRNGAARAYYAAFHEATPLAEQHCPDQNAHLRMGDHERLSERFQQQGSLAARSIGITLVAMKRVRKMADYEIQDPFTQGEARAQVALGKVFSERLTSFDQDQVRKVG